jgi:flagellar hook assembly protein FlgD
LLEGFEGDAASWTRVGGAPTVSAVPAISEGSSSLSLAYDLTAGTAEIERLVKDAPILTTPSTGLTVDLKGDGTYNTAYLKLRDASGEMFMYRLDAMRSSTPYPVSVDLTKPAAASSGGNGDGVLDAPVTFSRVLVVRNGSQPARGSATLDNLRASASGWSLPSASSSFFSPAKGESVSLAFEAATPGDYSISLRDRDNRVREISGTTQAGAVNITWDGRDGTGTLMQGDVRGVFLQDGTADGSLNGPRTQTGMPLVVTVGEADPASGVTTLVQGFNSAPGGWSTVAGTAALAGSAEVRTEGATALKIDYNVTTASAEVAETVSSQLADAPVVALKVDVKGDASYNTVFVKLRDASGEDFTYRVDAMRGTTWATVTVDLTKPPAASSGGNGDKTLDLPIVLRGFSIVRNGSQPAEGAVVLDNLRIVSTGWTKPVAAASFFTRENSGTIPFTFTATNAGDYTLSLSGENGAKRSFAGTALGAGEQTVNWDGTSDAGAVMSGDVGSVFVHDTEPDGVVSPTGSSRSGTVLAVTVATTVSGASVAESFDSNDDRWLNIGTGSAVSSTSTDKTEGAGSLAVAYDVTAGNASMETKKTPPIIAKNPISAFQIDMKGDSSYNTLYITLEDTTGETFMYRVDAMRLSRWSTVTVDVTRPPAANRHGNADGVLDFPVSLLGLSIARNGTTAPAKGTVLIDDLRLVGQGWTLPVASIERFSPATGARAAVSFTAGTAGDYSLTLADLSGRSRVFTGTAATPGSIRHEWDGKDGAGVVMAGTIKAQLRYDVAADSALASPPITAGNPYSTGISARPTEMNPRSIAGVNAFLTSLDDPAKADRQAALMEEAFLRNDREEFEWKRVEPRKGFFDWAKFDQAVAITDARNIQMVGKLGYTAPWASSAPSGTTAAQAEYYPPRNTSDFTDYVTAVVDRYKDKVHVWEVWNEPNSSLYWKPGPDGRTYGQVLKATYAAIKAVDPTATVLVGGLVGFDLAFMKGIESAGAGSSYDGLALHTYTAGSPRSGQTMTWLDAAASYLEKSAPGRSLWITEVGWPTCSQCTGATTEADQATYLSQTYLDAASRGIAGVQWYNLVGGDNPQARLDTFALTAVDGRKKPSYEMMRNIGAAFYQAESSGPAAATAANSSVKASDMASTTGFASAGISGGTAKISTTTSRHGGLAGFRLDYDYAGTSQGGQISTRQVLPGEPTAVSVWVYGDGSMSPIYLKLVDSTGERFQALVGNSGVAGWKKMTLYSDGSNGNYTHSGGNNDGAWNYPLSLTDVFVYKGTAGVTAGTIFLDDITVDYGVNVHGTVLMDRQGVTQAIYTAGPNRADVQVTGSRASLLSANGSTALPVEGDHVSVDLGPNPVFIESAIGVTTSGSGAGYSADISWIGGDRQKVTVQVIAASGALVRTIVTQNYYDAGRMVVRWDGRRGDGSLASPGNYTAKVTLLPPDGASIFTTTPFTVQ